MIGQKYKNRMCGSFGDASTFSFYANKHITTGEGGMILTNDKKFYKKCMSLRNLCFGLKTNRFNHDDIGWNYRLTNVQAAIGCGQLKNISWIINRKREIGKRYTKLLKKNTKIYIQPLNNNFSKNIYWVFGILIKPNTKIKRNYESFFDQSVKMLSLFSYRITGVGSDLLYDKRPSYVHEFDAGIGTFKLNKYFGGGIKSFRFNCPNRKIESINERTTCNMHPHNYYLEILTDLGIIGFLIFITLILLVLFKAYNVLLRSNNKYIYSPFLYIFMMEIFPIRSSLVSNSKLGSVIFFPSILAPPPRICLLASLLLEHNSILLNK